MSHERLNPSPSSTALLFAFACLLAGGACVLALVGMAAAAGPSPVWTDAAPADSSGASSPEVVAAGNGSFWVRWTDFNLGPFGVPMARYFDGSSGWSPQALVNDTSAFGLTFFQLAPRPQGAATAVFVESTTNASLWYVDYTPGTGWGPATRLSPPNGTVTVFQVSNPKDGRLALAWLARENATRSVWGAVRSLSGFGAPSLLEFDDTYNATGYHVFALPGGGATFAWSQRAADGFTYYWYNEFSTLSGWSGPRRTDGNDSENVSSAVVGFAPDGFELALWTQSSNGTPVERFATRFVGGAWTQPAPVPAAVAALGPAQFLSFAPAGFAYALFSYDNGTDGYAYVAVSRFDRATGWQAPENLNAPGSTAVDSTYSVVAFDPDSHAYLAWSQGTDANLTLWTAVHLEGAGWQPSVELSNKSGVTSLYGWLVPGAPQQAVVLWVDYAPGVTSVHARWFLDGVWTADAPLGFAAPADFEDYSQTLAVDANGNAMVGFGAVIAAERHAWVVRGAFVVPPLAIVITSPSEGSHTSLNLVHVGGRTDPNSTLIVNGVPVAVAPDGLFALNLTFAQGTWTILASAENVFKMHAQASSNFTVDDASVALTQALEGTQATLNATQADLRATQAELNGTRADLGATQSDLNDTRDAQDAASAALYATRDELARANASLAAADAAAAKRQDAASRQVSDLSGQATVSLLVALAALSVGGVGLAMGLRGKRPPA